MENNYEHLFSFKFTKKCVFCNNNLFQIDDRSNGAIYKNLNLPLSGISTCGMCAKKYQDIKKLSNTFNREIKGYI